MSGGSLPLAPELDAFRAQFEQISSDAEALVSPLTDDQFYWQPATGGWSCAQCVEHLNMSARTYLPTIDEGIAAAIKAGQYGTGPFTYNWLGRLIVAAVSPPPKMRVKAARNIQPVNDRPRAQVMAAFRAYQVQYVDRLRQADGLNLAKARVGSPVSPWIRLPLGSGFALAVAHQRRHLWQAARVVESPEFPRAQPAPAAQG
jgi:hypothetical protein